jgi:hypothetical protein
MCNSGPVAMICKKFTNILFTSIYFLKLFSYYCNVLERKQVSKMKKIAKTSRFILLPGLKWSAGSR